MREPRPGVFISSVNGRAATAWIGAYSATKFALEALADARRVAASSLGVDVILV